MPVQGLSTYALDVPDIEEGVHFYGNAGLAARVSDDVALFYCHEQARECVMLYGGAPRKRLNHVRLRADNLAEIAAAVPSAGGAIIAAPDGMAADGLWVRDPHGTLFHLVEHEAPLPMEPGEVFEINAPGRIVRSRRSAVRAIRTYSDARPRKLGHVVLFSPDVLRSVDFVTDAFGMGLADRSEDNVAFCCTRKNSDHHVVAFGKSPGTGFHHGSFQVADPDEVGRAGRALLEKTGRSHWGFGRHSIGSNFFHYIQDPWGSWFEYYSDMDHIDDYSLWTPSNYAPEDSMANWAPELPGDFNTNHELDTSSLFAEQFT